MAAGVGVAVVGGDLDEPALAGVGGPGGAHGGERLPDLGVGAGTGLGTEGGGALIGVSATVTSSMAQYQLLAASWSRQANRAVVAPAGTLTARVT
nr:hypothetical protein GCM10020063_043410 [Dactylosporangium thailandense]